MKIYVQHPLLWMSHIKANKEINTNILCVCIYIYVSVCVVCVCIYTYMCMYAYTLWEPTFSVVMGFKNKFSTS